MRTTPSPLSVAMSAMVSGTGVADVTRVSSLTPATKGAGTVLSHKKFMARLVSGITAVGVNPNTKVCRAPPPAILAGVFGVPVNALVVGSVVRKMNGPRPSGALAGSATKHCWAGKDAELMIVANAVRNVTI